MSVKMSNKNIHNTDVKEARISCEGLLPSSFRMQGKVPGNRDQATTNKTPLNPDNEDNVMVLGEKEWEDLFGNSMEITSFNGFSCKSSSEEDITINYNNKERQTWTKTLNTAVMECYFLSRPVDKEGKPVIRYRRRMHNIWKEQHNNVNTGERFHQGEENIHEKEATQVDRKNLGEEEKTMIQDILDLMNDKCRIEIRRFNK